MATNNYPMNTSNSQPYNTNDLPPPYSAVVGNPQYGFVVPSGEQFPAAAGGVFPQPKQFTPIGVYPHPTSAQPQTDVPPPLPGMSPPIDVVMPSEVGSLPTTVTCYNCGKVVVTKVTYTTSWHTHLVAGTICLITMVCSVCCLGLIPYCFDTFKDAEHYCPNCNTFIVQTSAFNKKYLSVKHKNMTNAETTQQVVEMEMQGQSRIPPPPYTITDPLQQPPVTNQPVRHETIIVQQFLKDEPIYVNCPSCHKRILTTIKFVNSNKTHLIAGFICGLTFWCLLCCLATLPYMLQTLKTADHYCSNCNYYIGSYSKL